MIKKIFTTAYLRIELQTNSRQVAALLSRSMSFGVRPEKSAVKISFFITHVPKSSFGDGDYSYHRLRSREGIATRLHHGCLASVSVDEKRMRVTGAVYDLKEKHHPRLAQTLFIDPLIQLLSLHGYQFLHCALIEKGGECVLVSGPSGSGKSTLSLALAMHGAKLLTDDKCLFRFNPEGGCTFLAMRQSIGVQPHLWRKFSAIRKFPSEIDCDGKRRRIPADSFGKQSADQFKFAPKAILFPKFRKGGKVRMKSLSAKEALKRLWADKSNACNAGRNKKSLSEALFSLHQLTKQTPAYQVFYNDPEVGKIGSLVEPLFAGRGQFHESR